MNQTMVDLVKHHAHQNYEKDGWDWIVETYTDKEIWEVIKDCNTLPKCIKKMKSIATLLHDREKDIEATKW